MVDSIPAFAGLHITDHTLHRLHGVSGRHVGFIDKDGVNQGVTLIQFDEETLVGGKEEGFRMLLIPVVNVVQERLGPAQMKGAADDLGKDALVNFWIKKHLHEK